MTRQQYAGAAVIGSELLGVSAGIYLIKSYRMGFWGGAGTILGMLLVGAATGQAVATVVLTPEHG